MQAHTDSLVIALDGPDDFAGFRQAARVLLALNAEPQALHWRWSDALSDQSVGDDLFAADAAGSLAGKALTPDLLDQLPCPPGQPLRRARWSCCPRRCRRCCGVRFERGCSASRRCEFAQLRRGVRRPFEAEEGRD